MKKTYIVVEIKGGFGNQLFQFMFAESLKKKGFKVKVKTDFYDQFEQSNFENTYRKLILPETVFGFKKTGKITNYLLELGHKINESKKLKKVFGGVKNPLFIKLKDSNYSKNKLNKKVVHLDGYWQNLDILISQREFLRKSLLRVEAINKVLNSSPPSNSAMVLVRRNDYLETNEDLKEVFYKNSIEYLRSNIENLDLNVFTDDVSWVMEKDIFSTSNNIFGPEEEPEKVIKLFAKMLNHKHFIIGNSTFSLMAAIINEQTDSIIQIASPWFRNRNDINFAKNNWIKVENLK